VDLVVVAVVLSDLFEGLGPLSMEFLHTSIPRKCREQ